MALPGKDIYELQGMTARGGYQMIDFENVPIPSADGAYVIIKGIHNYINSIYPCYKPIFVYNFKIIVENELTDYPPATNVSLIKEEDGSFSLGFERVTVHINTNDSVYGFIS